MEVGWIEVEKEMLLVSGTIRWNAIGGTSHPDAGPVLSGPCGLTFCPNPIPTLLTFLEPRSQGQPEQV